MNFEVVETKQENAKIKVVGVGGGGGNAILHMINHDIKGVDFICANTDTQALKSVKSATTIKLGNGLTKGLGAGADPDIGRRAAESDRMAKDFNKTAIASGFRSYREKFAMDNTRQCLSNRH